jgi:hypothetical protein
MKLIGVIRELGLRGFPSRGSSKYELGSPSTGLFLDPSPSIVVGLTVRERSAYDLVVLGDGVAVESTSYWSTRRSFRGPILANKLAKLTLSRT